MASLLKLVRHMEEELACEELKAQCPCKGKMGYVLSVPEFPSGAEDCQQNREDERAIALFSPGYLSSWSGKLITAPLNFSWYDARLLWRSQRWKFRGDLRWHSLPYLPSRW